MAAQMAICVAGDFDFKDHPDEVFTMVRDIFNSDPVDFKSGKDLSRNKKMMGIVGLSPSGFRRMVESDYMNHEVFNWQQNWSFSDQGYYQRRIKHVFENSISLSDLRGLMRLMRRGTQKENTVFAIASWRDMKTESYYLERFFVRDGKLMSLSQEVDSPSNLNPFTEESFWEVNSVLSI